MTILLLSCYLNVYNFIDFYIWEQCNSKHNSDALSWFGLNDPQPALTEQHGHSIWSVYVSTW